ncbi:hypothetical protein [Anaerovibrio sp. RM50]|uniref:hypothetical protein n=1 Tax=Anaerovibrio sp. RM50 TaxID=1200557 RepID=UPI000486D518|nr:hypothetical protein [Anaerovibrio sp. RM50]
MQGITDFLSEKAGRHVLQLLTLLKENMLARIVLFTTVCALLFPVFAAIDGLGDSSQAITAFSEGSSKKESGSEGAGFKEIKGIKEARDFQGLNNPFEGPQREGVDNAKLRRSGKNGAGKGDFSKGNNNGEYGGDGSDGIDRSGGSDEKGKSKNGGRNSDKKSLPTVKGIVEGTCGLAVLLEYGGSQYMLYPGDTVDNISVEATGENGLKVNVQGRIMWLEK